MRFRQKYRMRTPSTGREIIVEAEPDQIYLDRETGEEMEVVAVAAAAGSHPVRAALDRREPSLLQLVRPAGAEGPQRLPVLR